MNRSTEIFNEQYSRISVRTDKMFAYLFILQWVLGITLAICFSPFTWNIDTREIHLHVYEAILLGAIIPAYPLFLIIKKPGDQINRYPIAVAQMLVSSLLIHLTDGRIETHFHIFGSLAFLAFYRDWKVVVIATVVTAADHLLAALYWPQAVYGVFSAGPWRALEHTGWVIFEDIFLLFSVQQGLKELRSIAEKQESLELTIAEIESKVQERTQALVDSQEKVIAQQAALTASSKLSSLGEMAGGVAHEINNPLAVISQLSAQVIELVDEVPIDQSTIKMMLNKIDSTTQRIAQIVKGLRTFSRDAKNDSYENVTIAQLLEDTFSFCKERMRTHGIKLIVDDFPKEVSIEARVTELSQVVLNLLNNSCDALEKVEEKWIRVSVSKTQHTVSLSIIDSGTGIDESVRSKIFNPFFTTKELGKGTGLGLSISIGIIQSHGGTLTLDQNQRNTAFIITLPV